MSNKLLTTEQFAKLTGSTEDEVRELEAMGIISRTPVGLFPADQSVTNVVKFLRALATAPIATLTEATVTDEEIAAGLEKLAAALRARRGEQRDSGADLHGSVTDAEFFIGAGQAAERFSCSRDTIKRAARKHNVAVRRVGSRSRFDVRQLESVLVRKFG